MEIVNLSNLINDSCAISLLASLRSMHFSGIVPNADKDKEFFNKYLADYQDSILPLFSKEGLKNVSFISDNLLGKIQRLEKKCNEKCSRAFETNGIKKLFQQEDFIDINDELRVLKSDTFFNSGIYNLCMLIILIDKNICIDDEILLENSVGDYDAGYKLITSKMNELTIVHLGVADYVISADQKKNEFCGAKHYNVAPDMTYKLRTQRRFQACKIIAKEYSPYEQKYGDCYFSDVVLLIDLYRIRQQCLLEKIMIALLFIYRSYEYDEWMHEYALVLIDLLEEIFFCGEIHKIYIQEGFFDSDKENNKRTSKDSTTRLSVIFSAGNDDIYILRIDMPHIGENYFHINIEEAVGDSIIATGYPMTGEEISDICQTIDDESFDKLFFRFNGYIWFRSKFKKVLKNCSLEEKEKKKIETLFHKQSHREIATKELFNDGQRLFFMDELKKYLRRFKLEESRFLCFGKGDIDYIAEIEKIRGIYLFESTILGNLEKDVRTNSKEILECLLKCMCVDADKEKSAKVSSIIDVWEIIKLIV